MSRRCPSEARKVQVLRYLNGREALTIKQVATILRLGEHTVGQYLKELKEEGRVVASKSRPLTYYVPMRINDE